MSATFFIVQKIYTHLADCFSFLILYLLWRRGFFNKQRMFVVYFTLVFLLDLLFIYIGPLFGFEYTLPSNYIAYSLRDFSTHVLKILVAVSLYHFILRRFPNLRTSLDIVFYSILVILISLFVFSFNPAGSFIYQISIYFGRWTFLLMSLVCTFILVLVQTAGIRMSRSYLLIVWGFLLYSLSQSLNFFYLTLYYKQLSVFWRWFYQLDYLIPQLFWLWAALVNEEVLAPAPQPDDRRLPAEVLGRLGRLDSQAGSVLRKLWPFRPPADRI